ncbi:MAG: hypothetical protein ABR556_11255 [Pyrinomonadaceae bacterium]
MRESVESRRVVMVVDDYEGTRDFLRVFLGVMGSNRNRGMQQS